MGVLYVLSRADAEFTAPKITELLPEDASLAGVRKALSRLTEQGLVLERASGRTHSYRLNRNHLVAEAVMAAASAKSRLLQRMRDEIDSWEFAPLAVIIFGSAARNEMRTNSDIDVFVALPDTVDEDSAEDLITDLAGKISAWTGNDVRPLVYREHEIRPAPIFESILHEGLVVAGQPGWLRRILLTNKVAQ
ncbi:nucleotidyltransferase domain-containing protein [Crystallibacter crystallopoietes]|nr:nucleotidyltransferase domain-containing protein [Arthrobacter crystallopoietes]